MARSCGSLALVRKLFRSKSEAVFEQKKTSMTGNEWPRPTERATNDGAAPGPEVCIAQLHGCSLIRSRLPEVAGSYLSTTLETPLRTWTGDET